MRQVLETASNADATKIVTIVLNVKKTNSEGFVNGYTQKAKSFLSAAEIVHKASNDEETTSVAFYLLSHSVELSIKSVAAKSGVMAPPREHDKEVLAERYSTLCCFTPAEIKTITKLKHLNNGAGGLRYANNVRGQFNLELFNEGTHIVTRLLNIVNQDSGL